MDGYLGSIPSKIQTRLDFISYAGSEIGYFQFLPCFNQFSSENSRAVVETVS